MGATTVVTASFALSFRSTAAIVRAKAGSFTVFACEWTTTMSP